VAQNAGTERPDDERGRQQSKEDRESIWSIPAKYKRWYFGLFTAQVIIAAVWMIRTAIADDTLPGIPEKILFVWQGMAPMAISSAAFSLVLIDTWATSMVIASWLEETLEKRRQRQIRAAEDRGRAEVQKEWTDWNQRREAAATAGEEFNEPPPGVVPGSQDPQRE
jgi:hypothetical protein